MLWNSGKRSNLIKLLKKVFAKNSYLWLSLKYFQKSPKLIFGRFSPKIKIRAVQKNAMPDLVDREICWKISLVSFSEASIQPRRDPPKFDQRTPYPGHPSPVKQTSMRTFRWPIGIHAVPRSLLFQVVLEVWNLLLHCLNGSAEICDFIRSPGRRGLYLLLLYTYVWPNSIYVTV